MEILGFSVYANIRPTWNGVCAICPITGAAWIEPQMAGGSETNTALIKPAAEVEMSYVYLNIHIHSKC